MKILFIGARLFDDVALYTKKNRIQSIITESNSESPNLKLSDQFFEVSRGMEEPMKIAIQEEVDGVVPLIGVDGPLVDVAKMKEVLEKDHGIQVASSGVKAASICADKIKTKEFFVNNNIETPEFFRLSKNDNKKLLTELLSESPVVLKQGSGQGGSGIKIVSNFDGVGGYFDDFDETLAEKFLEGFEVSIEVLRWNGKTIPLVPVYKGKTTLNGLHPLKKVKKAPLDIDGVDNDLNNEKIRKIAVKIADTLDLEGTADIDLIFDMKTGKNYVIEINARPSGTRYITGASTNVYIMQELVKMVSGVWDPNELVERMKNYYSIEAPVGSYSSSK
ncbi:MAG: ATP-grasp domain-containing protein, partial [Methanobacterium sp.]|nr:ATP-grasp domain-containing protein [Methanobacterium sp.]